MNNAEKKLFAEMTARLDRLETATLAVTEHVPPADKSFIDQFHNRLHILEYNCGIAVHPHPIDDPTVTLEVPTFTEDKPETDVAEIADDANADPEPDEDPAPEPAPKKSAHKRK